MAYCYCQELVYYLSYLPLTLVLRNILELIVDDDDDDEDGVDEYEAYVLELLAFAAAAAAAWTNCIDNKPMLLRLRRLHLSMTTKRPTMTWIYLEFVRREICCH